MHNSRHVTTVSKLLARAVSKQVNSQRQEHSIVYTRQCRQNKKKHIYK